MPALPQRLNVLSELERLGRKYKFGGADQVKTLCPFHEDNTPSCSISTESGDFKCFACGKGGDFLSFIAKVIDRPRAEVFVELSQRYDLGSEPSIDPNKIEQWHQRIWEAGPLLKELRIRGVSDDVIRERRLGESEGRVTIPIKSKSGRFVNVRKYMPGAPGGDKMKNLKGRGSAPRLYPVDQLRFPTVVICGGEIKALVAGDQINKHGAGAVSTTMGEGNWSDTFNEEFRDKRVIVCYDVDDAGQLASVALAKVLYGIAGWVGILKLPLDREKHPKGDINDYVGIEGGDLWPLVQACEEFKPELKKGMSLDDVPEVVSLTQAYDAANTEKRVRLQAVVSAVCEETYVIPRRYEAKCDRAQECCSLCAVYVTKKTEYELSPEDPAILQIVEGSLKSKRDALCRASLVPLICPSVVFDVTEHQQADDVRISPKLEILNRADERSLQRVICVKGGLQLNETYEFVGRQFPHPQTQSATLLVSDYTPVGDALSNYDVSDKRALEVFRPTEWTTEAIRRKLEKLYADLEFNVTHIYGRRGLHVVMDLVWHSPLFINFDGRVEKGYVEALVVGDSSQGKSETAKRLLEHYQCGTKIECKNASVAGLLGGLQKLSGRWFVCWGVIPTNDKRMVILEEVKGASTEVISKMTDMRSSGIAEIPKIEKRRTTARARLLWISNPRGEHQMSTHNFGVEAIRELIGALEDVRRFDVCFIVAKEEINEEDVNKSQSEREAVPHIHTAGLCRDLVLWAWTRSDAQVRFEVEAEREVLRLASLICKTFSSDIPIVDVASMRLKLARLAASVACRTFSTDESMETCIVRACHVQFTYEFLVKAYSTPAFGYVDYTKAAKLTSEMCDADMIERAVTGAVHAKDFAENVLRSNRFDHQDVQDWCGAGRDDTAALMSLLVRKRAVVRNGRGYVKTPSFIEMLKRLVEGGELQDIPAFMKDGEF